jgi:uncharacterized protein
LTTEVKEQILAYGHLNVQAIHPTTLMITKEKELSKQGDCIIAVEADKAVSDLSTEFKAKLREPNAKLTIQIEVDGLTEQINAYGSSELPLSHGVDLVVRKSDFISDRTLAVNADKSSKDLPRALVMKLKNPQNRVKITLILT